MGLRRSMKEWTRKRERERKRKRERERKRQREKRERFINGVYGARIFLKQTIERLLNSSHISHEALEFAQEHVRSLRFFLEDSKQNISRDWLTALERKLSEAITEFNYGSQEKNRDYEITEEEKQVLQDVGDLTQKVTDEYTIAVRSNKFNHNAALPSSSIGFNGGKSTVVVGLSDQVSKITTLLSDWKLSQLFVSLMGMVGIGKTTLAKEIFQHRLIRKHFHYRVWVTLGPDYDSDNIFQDILAQIDPHNILIANKNMKKYAMMLAKHLSNILLFNRCLVVLDGVWNTTVLDYLEKLSPDVRNGSAILVTTTIKDVAVFPKTHNIHYMNFLSKEDSWCLLRDRVFGQDFCPPKLERAGRKIAEQCEGLPLTIITVAEILSKVDKSPEYWYRVAEKQNSVFVDAYDKMLEVLSLSYDYLPLLLKPLFLYMGVFPEKYEIPQSKLIDLWNVEGFIIEHHQFQDFAAQCLRDLVSRCLVIVRQKSTVNGIKSCALHSVYWHLCVKQGRNDNFFHVMKHCADIVSQGAENQPRLCIHNNILFAIESFYNFMASNANVHSLLCTGPHHQYPVPICLDSTLLSIFDALTLRFYLFPIQLLKQVELKYLALTYNGDLPSSISKLENLECFIVRQHMRIKSAAGPQVLPVEIWDMQELKHLHITGCDLPHPREGSLLSNLLTLSDVSARSCTKSVLESIPHLEKLGIRIESSHDEAEPLSCFDHISHLNKLQSLRCIIVNPIFGYEIVAPLTPLSNFPSGLKKLSLSGLGYPWEDMSRIAALPNLQVLKLRCYAFRGPKWEIEDDVFLQLELLLIEDSDLVHWIAGKESFRLLHCLSLKHCYRLKLLPWIFAHSLGEIEVVDCNPSISNWANKFEKYRRNHVCVQTSWDDRAIRT